MSSIEAMWTVRLDSPAGVDMELGGGVLVIETNRVFGGDSGYAYVGSCSVSGDSIAGELRIIRHDPNMISIFGDQDEFSVSYEGARVSENRIEGRISGGAGTPPATFYMERLVELP